MIEEPQFAVIYCRVSSPDQVKNGHGLSSQETRCREYAKHRRYNVIEVYQEEGISGSLLDRPKMQAMLTYLREHKKHHQHIVIIDDISRLARDIETHIRLRTEISSAGGKLESPSIEFGEDSDSRLVEHLLASVAAHQREKNAEQVKNRMKARMQNGYWVLSIPKGYKTEKVDGHGKMMVPDEPLAGIIKTGLEGLASGRFETPVEVKRYFESQPIFPRDRKGNIHMQRVLDILNCQLYSGYYTYEKWSIPLTKGKHKPLVSMETW